MTSAKMFLIKIEQVILLGLIQLREDFAERQYAK